MQPMYYIGLDVHKQKISYCVKDGSGKIYHVPCVRHDHFMAQLGQLSADPKRV